MDVAWLVIQYIAALLIGRRAGMIARNGLLHDARPPKLAILVALAARVWLLVVAYQSHHIIVLVFSAVLVAVTLVTYLLSPATIRARRGVLWLPIHELGERLADLVKHYSIVHVSAHGLDAMIALRYQRVPLLSAHRKANIRYDGCVHCAMIEALMDFEERNQQVQFRGVADEYESIVERGAFPYLMLNVGNHNPTWSGRYYRFNPALAKLGPRHHELCTAHAY